MRKILYPILGDSGPQPAPFGGLYYVGLDEFGCSVMLTLY